MTPLATLFRRHAKIEKAPAPSGELIVPTDAVNLSVRQSVLNLLVTRDGKVMAGYRIGPIRHNFLAMQRRRASHEDVTDGWANMAVDGGRDVQERVTTRPHPVKSWAKRLDERSPKRLPDVHVCDTSKFSAKELAFGACGCETWIKMSHRSQRRIAGTGMDDKVVFRYFEVGQVHPRLDVRAQIVAWKNGGQELSPEVKKIVATERRIFNIAQGPGWNATRMTQREQTWLRMRSVAPGIAAPSLSDNLMGLDEDDFRAELYDVRWAMDGGFDRTTKVTAFRNGKPLTRHVQILTCERPADMNWPENGREPWQVFAERAVDPNGRSFPVEWLIAGRMHTGADMAAAATMDLRKAREVREGYREHGEEPPPVIDRGIRRAKETHDEVTTGNDAEANRFVGTINAMVTGEDVFDERGKLVKSAEEVAWERGEAFASLMGGNQLKWKFSVPTAQADKLREFVPGEDFDRAGYQHQFSPKFLAAGMANAAAVVGDGHGPYIGYTQGAARRPVMHDSHYGTEGRGRVGRKANLWVVIASLGGGKSVLLIVEAYNSVRRGITTVINDPAGRMGPMLLLPEIAPYSIERNMTLAERGEASPYVMVPEPAKELFMLTDELTGEPLLGPNGKKRFNRAKWEEAVSAANVERSLLGQETARMFLPADLYYREGTQSLLRKAARNHGPWQTHNSLFDLEDELRKIGGEFAIELADEIHAASETTYLKTLFAPKGQGNDFLIEASKKHTLELITTPGLKRAAEGKSRHEWTPGEIAAEPMLHMAALRTNNIAYSKPRTERAVVIFDEADNLTTSQSGRTMATRLGRDHSGNNLEVWFASQDLHGVMAGDIRNYVAGMFVGQMKNKEQAEELLPLMNIEDKSYAETLLRLSRTEPGEFVHADADGRVEVIKIDIPDKRLAEVAFTNPDPEGSSAWDAEEELA